VHPPLMLTMDPPPPPRSQRCDPKEVS
jgi:hypothetical protein